MGFAALLVAVLARGNRSLQARYDAFVEQATYLHAGVYVPVVQAETLDGDSITLGMHDHPDGRQVLIFFTTTCPYCRASLQAWTELYDTLEDDDAVEVYGLALDSLHLTQEYIAEHELPFAVTTLADRRTAELYRARAVPITTVLDAEGRVVYSRRGAVESQIQLDSILTAVEWRREEVSEDYTRSDTSGDQR